MIPKQMPNEKPKPVFTEVNSCFNCYYKRGAGNLLYVWYDRCLFHEFNFETQDETAYIICPDWKAEKRKT